jgi:hypothetical protein
MQRFLPAILYATLCLTTPLAAQEDRPAPRILTEYELGVVSDAVYSQLLQGAMAKGHRFTPEQIASGRRRHQEELRLRLIDQGVRIVAGQPSV